MSSDVSSASYTLDNSGIIIQFDLKDFTSNTKVEVSPFTDITNSFTITNYSNYNMTAFNVSAISQYNCDITDNAVIGGPLVEFKSEFFCFKVGAQKQIKLY
jgi:hypothetical protein